MAANTTNDDSENHNGASPRVTMKDIAREVGVSHVSVSKALRGLRGVSPATKERILKKAEEMGYVQNPLLTVLSSYRKISKTKPIQAELAWINFWKNPDKILKYETISRYWEGARAGANQLGFQLQAFNAAEMSRHRLDQILKSRCIQGILIPPAYNHVEGWESFPWSDYASVVFGRTHPYPKTHVVTSAQTANTILSFDRMTELGYQRIGYTCELLTDRYFGAGFAWAQKKLPASRQLPIHFCNADDPEAEQRAKLDQWIREYRPDAILNDYERVHTMLIDLGYRIPEDIGLAGTSVLDSTTDAGIDQKPFEVGRAAVRTLIALLTENNFGIPETLNEILVEGQWVDGSMLPKRKA